MNLEELIQRIDEISDTVNEVGMEIMEVEAKVQQELVSRINSVGLGIGLGGSVDSVDASSQGLHCICIVNINVRL